jgi:hypothetical protein
VLRSSVDVVAVEACPEDSHTGLAPVRSTVADRAMLGFGSLHGRWHALLAEGGLGSMETRRTRTASSVAGLGLVGDSAVGSRGGTRGEEQSSDRE